MLVSDDNKQVIMKRPYSSPQTVQRMVIKWIQKQMARRRKCKIAHSKTCKICNLLRSGTYEICKIVHSASRFYVK